MQPMNKLLPIYSYQVRAVITKIGILIPNRDLIIIQSALITWKIEVVCDFPTLSSALQIRLLALRAFGPPV
jgi:hypothetical protein